MLTIAFGAGIILDRYLEPSALVWICWAAACAAACLFAVPSRKNGLAAMSVMLLAVSVGACGHYVRCRHLPEDHISRFTTPAGGIVRLAGYIDGAPTYAEIMTYKESEGRVSFTMNGLELILDDGKRMPVAGKIKLNTDSRESGPVSLVTEFLYGTELDIVGRLRLIREATNPGQFNFGNHYEDMGVYAEYSFLDPRNMKVTGRAGGNGFMRLAGRIKRQLNEAIFHRSGQKGFLDDSQASLVSALILGDRTGIDMKPFQVTGTIHFLSISGLNVVIMASIFWWALRLCRLGRLPTALILAVVVATYAVITEGRPPVVRASVMIILFMLADVINRPRDVLNVLALSALILLVMSPANLFYVSFQLSFLAVLCMTVFHKRLDAVITHPFAREPFDRLRKKLPFKLLSPIIEYLRRSTNISLSVWMGLFPLLALVFHLCTPLTFVVNILMLPFITAITYIGVVILFLGGLFGAHLSFVYILAGWSVDAVNHIADFFAVNGTWFHLVGFTPLLVILYYVVLLVWLNRSRLKVSRFILIPAMAAILVAVVIRHNSPVAVPQTEITALDVGRGTTAVVRTDDGRTILFDAAGGKEENTVKYLIAPFLDTLRVRNIDALIVTDTQSQRPALASIIGESFYVRNLYTPANAVRDPAQPAMHSAHISFLGPVPAVRPEADGSSYSRARDGGDSPPPIVMMLMDRGRKVLFTGDMTEGAIANLLEGGQDLRADVLIAPNHGSWTIQCKPLFDAVKPAFVIAARATAPLADWCSRNGAALYTTIRSGAVTIRLGKDIEIATYIASQHPTGISD